QSLSENIINQNFRSRLEPDANTLLYYNFDGFQTSQNVADLSGNFLSGRLVNPDSITVAASVDSVTYSLSENANSGDSVGLAIGYSADISSITFSKIGGSTSSVNIDPTTGVISVSLSAILDYETDSILYLTYEVNKTIDGLKDTATVSIRLINE